MVWEYGGLEYFQSDRVFAGQDGVSPCAGIWGKASDEVVDSLGRPFPMDFAVFLEYLGSRCRFYSTREGVLRDGGEGSVYDVTYGFECKSGPEMHEPVVDIAHIVGG